MESACLKEGDWSITLIMRKWLAVPFVVVSAFIAQAQGDITGETVTFFEIERMHGIPVVAGQIPPPPATPLTLPAEDFQTLLPTFQGSAAPTITTIPEPAPFQLIYIGLGLLAMRKFGFFKRQ